MKKMMKRLRNERGLTLVELLAVVVILAIIGTIAFVMIGNVIENSKKDAHVSNAQQLIAAAKLYEASGDHGESYTISTDEELDDYIEELINPWDSSDTTYKGTVEKDGNEYKVTITGSEITCDISKTPESTILQGREEVCGKD